MKYFHAFAYQRLILLFKRDLEFTYHENFTTIQFYFHLQRPWILDVHAGGDLGTRESR